MKGGEVKNLHLSMLAEMLDERLSRFDFLRNPRSVKYTRRLEGGEQRIDTIYTISGRSDDLAICHIQPIVSIGLDRVNSVALEMVGGNERLLGTPRDTTVAVPLGFLGPERGFRDWRPLNEADYRDKIVDLGCYVEDHAMPFLNQYHDADALVAGYRQGEDRFLVGQPLAIRATAAAVCCSRYDMARSFVESAFSKAGPRRKYACLFEYLDRLQAS